MSATHWYRGHGLLIRSDLALPEFAPAAPGDADLEIVCGTGAAARFAAHPAADPKRPALFETPEGMVLSIPDVGAFHVQGGRRVEVSPVPGHDPGALRLYLVGSVSAILFHQRGQHVLHGAAIVRPGGVSLFVGESGAGKSTLAAHLGARGHAVLSDDALVLHETAEGRCVAWPGSRVFKLWEDALAGLGTGTGGLARIANRENKYFWQNPALAEDRAHPLDEIFVLDRAEGPPRLEALTTLETLGTITTHTYRPELLARTGNRSGHFRSGAALAASLRGYRLTRPWRIEAMGDVIELLEAHWAGAALAGAGRE